MAFDFSKLFGATTDRGWAPGTGDMYTGSALSKLTSGEQAAFGAGGGTLDATGQMTAGTPGFGLGNLTLGQGLGAIKGLTGLANAYTGYKQLGLAEEAFDFNKAAANREYAANVQKYNNALARTAAIDKHYGSQTAGTAI